MLETFRKFSQHIVFKILFGLLLVSFALSGLTGLAKLNFSQDYIVKVGSEKITQQNVDIEYDRTVRNIRASGLDFTDAQLMAFGISKPQILRTQVQESLLRQEIHKLGLQVGDEAVAEKIKTIPDFQIDGKFDREKFNDALAHRGLREDQFLTDLHTAIQNDLLISTIKNNIPTNDFIVKQQVKYYGQTRDVETIIIPKQFRVVTEVPLEKDLKEFYDENSIQFQIPETRDIQYIVIPKSKDNDPATYDLTIKIQDELAGGSTMKEIADKLHLKLQEKQGLAHDSDDFSQLFLDTAFGKDKGQESDLVADDKSGEYFAIEVKDVHEARIPDLKEVHDKAVALWKDDQTNNQNLQYISDMAEKLKTTKQDLHEFASQNGFSYQLVKNVKRTDTEKYGARLVNDSFDAEVGDVIGQFQNEDGTYKIAKLKAINQNEVSEQDAEKYKTDLAQTFQGEILDEYLEYLKTIISVTQNSKLVAKEDDTVPKPVTAVPNKKPIIKLFKRP